MVGIIVQARTGSSRLPGKVLKKVLGKTLLEHEISRLKKCKEVDKIVVATTNNKRDNEIVKISNLIRVKCFRGEENDVLDRYYQCAIQERFDVIVRITGDCPLIDQQIVDKVIKFYKKGRFDYATNGIHSTFPDGMDVEVFSFKALEKAWWEAKLESEHEHVTAYIWKNKTIFKIGTYKENIDNSHLRLTVDEPEDFVLVKKIFTSLYPKNHDFSLDDIIVYLKKNPALVKINSKIGRNEGYFKSISKEKIRVGKLSGKRIFVRDLTLGDVSLRYCRWLNDPKVNKYLETKGATIEKLKSYVAEKIKDPMVVFLGIFDKSNKKHIGNIKLEPVDFVKKTAELGILIGDKNYWGKGFASEAIDIVCNCAFKTIGLKYITLGVYSSHKSAIKAYERAGFKFFSKKKGSDGTIMKRENKSYSAYSDFDRYHWWLFEKK